jgi:hypothetical protein
MKDNRKNKKKNYKLQQKTKKRQNRKRQKQNTSLTTKKFNLDKLLAPECTRRKPKRWKSL